MSSTTVGLLALRIVMKAAGVRQADLSRELGCSRAWVHDVVHGQVRPSPNFVRMAPIVLAHRLGEDPAELRQLLFPDFVEAVA